MTERRALGGQQLCERLGLDFDEAMLSWPAGPRPEDGVWAPHWYHNVHRSTGFAPYRPKTDPFPERLEGLLEGVGESRGTRHRKGVRHLFGEVKKCLTCSVEKL